MKILIKNGRVIDPATNFDRECDILTEDNKILKIDSNITAQADTTIDAQGCIVVPGLIDLHVHFREPGREDKETILGGSYVAAKAGFTSVCTMGNTTPPIDNQALVRFIKLEAEKGPIKVYPAATVTKGLAGEEISEMGELVKAGAVAFTDDGKPLASSVLMRRALEYSKMFNVPIMAHEEDMALTDGGIMHEGQQSTLLGIRGIPRESEEVMIARDIMLARLTGGKLHIQHLSSGNSVKLVRDAKAEGIAVTCETAPHYFSLTDAAVKDHLAMAKMNPPLREAKDRDAIIEGLHDGTIDAIATDHAPHLSNEKRQEIEFAPFGIIGLETAVPLTITNLIRNNGFSYIEAFSKLTINPARIISIDAGYLKEGGPADITVINPDKKVLINDEFFVSKCKNSPFKGMELFGKVEYTIANGKIVK